jgi:AraC-like DNA-binding protein
MEVDERERRLALNEALFREANERVETVADRLGQDVPYEFLCECANADCTFRISLPLSVYESIRADPRQFVVLPLHYTPEVEDLVSEEDTHWVVRKTGEAGEYVEHLDPRSR